MALIETPCIQCELPVELESDAAQTSVVRCDACGTVQAARFYPSLRAPTTTTPPTENLTAHAEAATCFNHVESPAAGLCDSCGRYVCDLCLLEIPESPNRPDPLPRITCPSCFEKIRHDELRDGTWDLFRTRYPRYDLMVYFLVAVPILCFPLFVFSPFTLSLAVYIIIRHWRDFRDPARSYRVNLLFGGLFMVATILIWAIIAGLLAASMFGGGDFA